MILESYKLLLIYSMIWLLPDFIHVNGFVTGKIQFFRNKYFDERSIHADIGRDMNVVCNHVKAFNAGKPNNRDTNEMQEYTDSNVAENRPIKEERYMGAKTNELVANNVVVNKQDNKDFIDMSNYANKLSETPLNPFDANKLSETPLNPFDAENANVHKREVLMMGGKSGVMEQEGNAGSMPDSSHQPSPAGSATADLTKRLVSKHYNNPEEMFRKKNAEILKNDLNSLHNMRSDNQFQSKFSLQDPNNFSQMLQDMNQQDMTPMHMNYQENMEGSVVNNEPRDNEIQLKEHPIVSRLFEKQRQIENLKQLLLQVESKFQMEVNEVGRLQQSVAEAEKELDEAVRLMQEVKIKNIRGMQHIEAAQDAAGRNLESKALKAHAEESQLAMHDQVLFSERQRLNALRAQMIYLQTELASAQNSGLLSFDNDAKCNFEPYAFHYKRPSLTESLKYFQNSPSKQSKNIGPYVNTDGTRNTNNDNMTFKKNPYLKFT